MNATLGHPVAEDHGAAIKRLVDEQAEDEGLWFIAATMPEAYLQQELRRLHHLIETGELLEGPRD